MSFALKDFIALMLTYSVPHFTYYLCSKGSKKFSMKSNLISLDR